MVGVLVIDMRKLSSPPIWLFFEQGCAQVAAGAPFAVGAGGCCGLACGQDPAMSDARPHRRLRLPRPCPRSRPCGFWAVLQEKGADFAMGPGLLGGFRRELLAVSFSDLGETPTLGGVSGRFALRNRPEVCRWGLLGLKVAHEDVQLRRGRGDAECIGAFAECSDRNISIG